MSPNACLCNVCMKNSDSDEIIFNRRIYEPVFLNVYNMFKINDFTSTIGFGIFHSGVEVYGIEYGFGGHQYNHSGIFTMEPKNDQALSDFFNMRGNLKFKQSILIGYTSFSYEEVEVIRDRLSRKFKGNKYHLLHNNCNHFSAKFVKILCRKSIPRWVNRLANVSTYIPFIQKFLPNEWLTPKAWPCDSQNVIN